MKLLVDHVYNIYILYIYMKYIYFIFESHSQDNIVNLNKFQNPKLKQNIFEKRNRVLI